MEGITSKLTAVEMRALLGENPTSDVGLDSEKGHRVLKKARRKLEHRLNQVAGGPRTESDRTPL